MRSYVTFVIVVLMTAALVFTLVTRDRTKYDAPAEVIQPPEGADAAAADAGADAASAVVVDAGPAKPTEKPLRIAALGWELVAAGAAITPVLGGAPPAPAPPIELAPETTLDAVEARLARGGGDPQGADIAILPLPAFVASFEKLRALEPRAFLVLGFSHGREEVHAAPGALFKAPSGAEEVKLVALGPQASAEARTASSESATALGLFALDLLGVAPSRIRLVPPATPEAKAAQFAAIVKGTSDDRKLAFSTADASRFVPIVAVAPKSLLDAREPVVRAWSTAWLDGLVRAGKDVPGVARRLAAKEALPLAAGVGGAPEALVLVEHLGQIENSALADQTSLIGPLAKSAATLETLAQRTWQLERSAGLTANAAPEPLPIDARVVSMIAPPPVAPAPSPAAEGDGGLTFGSIPSGAVPLLSYRAVDGDAEKAAGQIALLAGVFERAYFKISAKGGEKAARTIATAAHDKGVLTTRLVTTTADAATVASVEIIAPP
jgi:hypothetical protein